MFLDPDLHKYLKGETVNVNLTVAPNKMIGMNRGLIAPLGKNECVIKYLWEYLVFIFMKILG